MVELSVNVQACTLRHSLVTQEPRSNAIDYGLFEQLILTARGQSHKKYLPNVTEAWPTLYSDRDMPFTHRLLFFLLPAVIGVSAHAQLLNNEDPLDPRFQEDQRIESETPLGRLSVGVSGISEDARNQTTRGDVEFGSFYQHEFDAVFPRILELRPFVFNRIDSTDDAYYASLGVGIGTRVSLRKKHEKKNWFARLSVLTPTELYRERYGSDRDDQSIAELFAGFEFTLNDGFLGHEMRRRLSPPKTIYLRVPARMMDRSQPIPPDVLAAVHAMMIEAYLSQVYRQRGAPSAAAPLRGERWPVIEFIEEASGEELTPAQRFGLAKVLALEPEEDLARRRRIASDFLERGLMSMMRGEYPFLIEIAAPISDPSTDPNPSISITRMSLPGMNVTPRNEPLDADTMIRHYIASYQAKLR